jgi:hypothetical protein
MIAAICRGPFSELLGSVHLILACANLQVLGAVVVGRRSLQSDPGGQHALQQAQALHDAIKAISKVWQPHADDQCSDAPWRRLPPSLETALAFQLTCLGLFGLDL